MKTKYIRITKFTLAMLILIVVRFSNVIAQEPLPPTTTINCVSGNCVNGNGKMVYANGDIYEGDFVNGKKAGQGTFKYKHGTVYVGRFANDKFNGKGKLNYTDGEIYDGNFVNGEKEGQGTHTYPSGSYYTGEWKDNSRNGYGKEFISQTNIKREGIWKDDDFVNSINAVQANPNRENLLNKIELYSKPVRGLGKEIDTFAEELKTNTSTPARVEELYNLIEQYSLKILTARHETLKVLNLEPESAEKTDLKKLVEADIAVMNTNLKAVGQWKELELKDKSTASNKCVSGNCVIGKGKMVYTNGNSYEGDFVDGKRKGQGIYTFKNGQVYVGQFSDDLRNGKGKFTFSDGSVYEGSFVKDNFIGHGTYTSKSGSNQAGKFTVGQIVDLKTKIVDTDFWGKAEIIEILGDNYKVRDLWFNTIEIVAEQKIRPFTAPVKYEIGQKVEVMDKGIWYKGEIIANEVEYNDHYRIRFEGTTNRSDLSENVRYIRPGIGTSTAQTKREILVSTNNDNSQGRQPPNASTTSQNTQPNASASQGTQTQPASRSAIAQKELDSQLDKYTAEINKLISRYNDFVAKYGDRTESRSMKYEVSGLCFKAINLIDTFLLVYADQVSPKTKANLLQSRKNYLASMKQPIKADDPDNN